MRTKKKTPPSVPFEGLLDKHLKGASQKEVMAYLNACLGDGDDGGLEVFFKAIEDIARAKGIADLADKAGKARDTFYKAFAGKNPTLATFRTVLHSLNMEIAVRPRK